MEPLEESKDLEFLLVTGYEFRENSPWDSGMGRVWDEVRKEDIQIYIKSGVLVIRGDLTSLVSCGD